MSLKVFSRSWKSDHNRIATQLNPLELKSKAGNWIFLPFLRRNFWRHSEKIEIPFQIHFSRTNLSKYFYASNLSSTSETQIIRRITKFRKNGQENLTPGSQTKSASVSYNLHPNGCNFFQPYFKTRQKSRSERFVSLKNSIFCEIPDSFNPYSFLH